MLAFVLDAEQVARLATRLKKCLPRAPGEARLWVAYPKLTSDIDTDLTRDRGWDTLTALGLRGVAIVSVDDTWAAVRFRPQA